MKNALVAMMCTLGPLGLLACGERRPAEEPQTVTTSVTTETTTTAAPTARRTTTPSYSGGAEANPNAAGASASATTAPANAPSTTGVAPTIGDAPTTNNPGTANDTKDADNTKINDRDRHGALTPMDQGGGKDRDITAAIRRSVVADKALSFTAKNVKIITNGGKVTLRGPVNSDAERSAIEAKAKATTGVSEVDNQLEVKK